MFTGRPVRPPGVPVLLVREDGSTTSLVAAAGNLSSSERVRLEAEAAARDARSLTAYTVNIILSTILFMVVFVAGTSWTMAVNKQFEGQAAVSRYWLFAAVMTAVTIAMSIGFGELSKLVSANLKVRGSSLFGPDDAVLVE